MCIGFDKLTHAKDIPQPQLNNKLIGTGIASKDHILDRVWKNSKTEGFNQVKQEARYLGTENSSSWSGGFGEDMTEWKDLPYVCKISCMNP